MQLKEECKFKRRKGKIEMYKKYVKRAIDIIISTIALIILSPFFLIISILVKVIDKNPVFYKQYRTGLYGKNFKIYKFTTMKNGKATKIGKFFRATSLDELPQFFNVLKGDMSIVGPRPWIPEYYENFDERQKQRSDVKPGIIGLAQVKGRRRIDIFEKIDYDLKYVRKVSILQDIKIFFKCVRVLIAKEEYSNADAYISNEIDMLKERNNKQK